MAIWARLGSLFRRSGIKKVSLSPDNKDILRTDKGRAAARKAVRTGKPVVVIKEGKTYVIRHKK